MALESEDRKTHQLRDEKEAWEIEITELALRP